MAPLFLCYKFAVCRAENGVNIARCTPFSKCFITERETIHMPDLVAAYLFVKIFLIVKPIHSLPPPAQTIYRRKAKFFHAGGSFS